MMGRNEHVFLQLSSSKDLGISSYMSGQASSRSQRAGWESPEMVVISEGIFSNKMPWSFPETDSEFTLKIDGWKMEIPFRDGLCSGAMSVSGRVILFMYLDLFLGDFFRILPRYSSPCFTTIWENMFYFVPSILSKSKCILKSYTKYLPYKEPTAIPFRRVAFCESMIVQPTSTVGEVSPRDNRTLSTKKTISTPRRP